jgi:nucleoside-diphosphate-sugar epimerase
MREVAAITGGAGFIGSHLAEGFIRNNGAERQMESAVPSPRSPYGLSKWMGELYAAQFARFGALETGALRYFNVFGPRQNLEGGYAAVIPLFVQKLADGISSPKSQIFVKDL